MPQDTEVKVPDIGDFDDVEIIEVAVAPGDRVEAEQALPLELLTVNHLVTSLVLVPQQVKIVNSMALLPKAVVLEVVLIIDTHQNQLEVMVVVVEVPQDIVMVDLEVAELVQHYKVSKLVEVVPSIILAVAEVQQNKVLTTLVHQVVVME